MLTYTLIGGTVVIALALLKDANGTIQLVTAIITVKGVGWLCQKMIDSYNKDYGDLINFTSWSLAGVSIIGVIKNCIGGFNIIVSPIHNAATSIAMICTKIGELVDKLSWWN